MQLTMNMNGKTCLVTGATAGIGEVTACELARMGARVLLVSRDPQRCAETTGRIREKTGNSAVEYLTADLSSQAQVRRLSQEIRQRCDRLDVLVNNAGAIFMRRQESEDGIEMTWALNHLSYFLLTNLLLDLLKDSAPARIVNVSSDAHRGAKINFNDLEAKRGYSGFPVYGRSKLANILFTFELARRLEGTGVTANALHPGFVATRFAKNNGLLVTLGLDVIYRFFALSPEQGARTSLYLAASPEVEGISGKYFVKERSVKAASAAYDQETAQRLWQVSAEMVGLNIDVYQN
jgi:NAD(P)-dependent dehydrogenase (short-subunit alcohol dehydrogenase family)